MASLHMTVVQFRPGGSLLGVYSRTKAMKTAGGWQERHVIATCDLPKFPAKREDLPQLARAEFGDDATFHFSPAPAGSPLRDAGVVGTVLVSFHDADATAEEKAPEAAPKGKSAK